MLSLQASLALQHAGMAESLRPWLVEKLLALAPSLATLGPADAPAAAAAAGGASSSRHTLDAAPAPAPAAAAAERWAERLDDVKYMRGSRVQLLRIFPSDTTAAAPAAAGAARSDEKRRLLHAADSVAARKLLARCSPPPPQGIMLACVADREAQTLVRFEAPAMRKFAQKCDMTLSALGGATLVLQEVRPTVMLLPRVMGQTSSFAPPPELVPRLVLDVASFTVLGAPCDQAFHSVTELEYRVFPGRSTLEPELAGHRALFKLWFDEGAKHLRRERGAEKRLEMERRENERRRAERRAARREEQTAERADEAEASSTSVAPPPAQVQRSVHPGAVAALAAAQKAQDLDSAQRQPATRAEGAREPTPNFEEESMGWGDFDKVLEEEIHPARLETTAPPRELSAPLAATPPPRLRSLSPQHESFTERVPSHQAAPMQQAFIPMSPFSSQSQSQAASETRRTPAQSELQQQSFSPGPPQLPDEDWTLPFALPGEMQLDLLQEQTDDVPLASADMASTSGTTAPARSQTSSASAHAQASPVMPPPPVSKAPAPTPASREASAPTAPSAPRARVLVLETQVARPKPDTSAQAAAAARADQSSSSVQTSAKATMAAMAAAARRAMSTARKTPAKIADSVAAVAAAQVQPSAPARPATPAVAAAEERQDVNVAAPTPATERSVEAEPAGPIDRTTEQPQAPVVRSAASPPQRQADASDGNVQQSTPKARQVARTPSKKRQHEEVEPETSETDAAKEGEGRKVARLASADQGSSSPAGPSAAAAERQRVRKRSRAEAKARYEALMMEIVD